MIKSIVKIYPNNDKDNLNYILELVLKYNNKLINDIDDIYDEINYLTVKKINFTDIINDYNMVNEKYNLIKSNTNYDFKPLIKISNKIYGLLYNSVLNNQEIIDKIEDKNILFNLFSSNLLQYSTNSSAIFGNCYLICLDEYIQNNLDDLYYDISKFDFIDIIVKSLYVDIINVDYVTNNKNIIKYDKTYIYNYIEKNETNKMTIYDKYNLIKINHDNSYLIIKYDDPLFNTHLEALSIIPDQYINNKNYNIIDIDINDENLKNVI